MHDLLGVVVGILGPALMVYLWAWDGPTWLPHTLLLRLTGSLVGLIVVALGYSYPMVRYLQRMGSAGEGPGPGRRCSAECCWRRV